MARTGRWLAAIAAGLAALAACTALADLALPWDTATDIGLGGAAGVVVGAFLAVWTASAIDHATADQQTAPPVPNSPGVSARQKTGGAGVQVTQSGRTRIRNQTINVTAPTPPDPPPDDGAERDGVVPPKA